MSRLFKWGIALMIVGLMLVSSSKVGLAQVPSYLEEWTAPTAPPGYYSWSQLASGRGYSVTGPIIVGGVAYSTKVLNRNYQDKNTYALDDQPFYCEISAPAGSVLNYVVGIIEYHPPGYQIRSLLPGTEFIFIGTAGSTSKLGPFSRGSADPEGKYAWRIGLMALIQVAAGTYRWYWATTIQYYNFGVAQIVGFQILGQNPPAVSQGESTH